MNNISRGLGLILLAGIAVISYVVGFMPGLGIFLVLGVLFEIPFWLKLFRRPISVNGSGARTNS